VSRIFLVTQTGPDLRTHKGQGPHLRRLIANNRIEVEHADEWWVALADSAKEAKGYVAGGVEERILAKGGKRKGQPAPQPGSGGTTGGVPIANGFPHMWRYTYTRGNGDAIMNPPNVFNDALVAGISRWHATTVGISPWSDSDQPVANTIFAKLKALNPAIQIYLYNTCSLLSQNLGPNPTSFVREAWLLATSPTNLRLYNIADSLGYPSDNELVIVGFDLGLAGPRNYANIWKKYGATADGYWFDYFIGPIADFRLSGKHVNPAIPAPGYASEAAMNTAFNGYLTTFATEMASAAGLKVGNSGGYTSLAIHQALGNAGELMENWYSFNFNGYNTMDAAMARALQWQGSDPTGDGTVFMASYDSLTQTSTTFAKEARFTLGSACVAGGMGYTGNLGITYGASTGLGTLVNHDMNTWADEYTVDTNGVSDGVGTIPENRGWLGRPTAFGFKAASGCYVREFDRGIVVVNGTLSTINHPLTGNWRRIQGVFDTVVNNGAAVSGSVSVPAFDARFLLRAA
jgi:hypothetical protein